MVKIPSSNILIEEKNKPLFILIHHGQTESKTHVCSPVFGLFSIIYFLLCLQVSRYFCLTVSSCETRERAPRVKLQSFLSFAVRLGIHTYREVFYSEKATRLCFRQLDRHLLPAPGQLMYSSRLSGVAAEKNFSPQVNAVRSEMSPPLLSEWLAELIWQFLF